MTEVFYIASYDLGEGNLEKRIALITNQRPVYSRLCQQEYTDGTLKPLMSITREGKATAFRSEYIRALDNDDIAKLDQLAPRVAIGFSAFILSKARWNERHSRWDITDDNLRLKDEYDALYKHPEDTLAEHHSQETHLWEQTQAFWESGYCHNSSEKANALFDTARRRTEVYLSLVNADYSQPSTCDLAELQMFFYPCNQDKAEQMLNDLGDLTGKEAAEVVMKYTCYMIKKSEYLNRIFVPLSKIKRWPKNQKGNWNKKIKELDDKDNKRKKQEELANRYNK